MPRPIILFTGQWADVPLEELAQKAAEWGYQGLDLACGGEHFSVRDATSKPDYCQKRIDLLGRFDLTLSVLSNHRAGQAVCDQVDERHRALVPDYVWGNGDAAEVSQRAAEEMLASVRAAQQCGVSTLAGFTGSPIWSYVGGYPAPTEAIISAAFADFRKRFGPILDACADAGIRFACEVHPGQLAFDLYSAEMLLDAVNGRDELGFLFDPTHLHWQGVDPVEFLRRFRDRIYHVHVKDVALSLNGRSGILNSYFAPGDSRRGWDSRSPGHGGLDWQAIIRGLNEIGYTGPLAVEWKDSGMDREYGAEDACKFVQRLNFEPSAFRESQAFRES